MHVGSKVAVDITSKAQSLLKKAAGYQEDCGDGLKEVAQHDLVMLRCGMCVALHHLQ